MPQQIFSRRQLRAALGLVTATALSSLMPAPSTKAQEVGDLQGEGGRQVSSRDRAWMQELAQANLFAITLGRLLLAKSDEQEIQAFASRMVRQHRALQSTLRRLAGTRGVALPKVMQARDIVLEQKLLNLSGCPFASAALEQAGLADRQALLARIAGGADDAELRMLAQAALAESEAQLWRAQALRTALQCNGLQDAIPTR